MTQRRRRAVAVATAALVVLVGAGGAFALWPSRHVLDRERLLRAIAEADELDVAFSYDVTSGRVAFANDSGTPGLFLADAAGGAPHRLPITARWPRRPTLSRGGAWLAYHELDTERLSWEHKLFLLDVAHQRTTLVRETGDDDFVSRALFSPDGRMLVYELVHKRGDKWQDELRQLDLESGRERPLYAEPGVPARGPAFAPDGRTLYVMSGSCVRAIDGAAGSARTVACVPGATDLGMPDAPAVSADGARIAFALKRDGCARLFVTSSAGGGWRAVDEHECGMRPQWLAGSALAYVAPLGDGNRVVRVRDVDAGTTRTLGFTHGIAYDLAPSGRDLLALVAAPGVPRSLWRLGGDGGSQRLVYTPLPLAVAHAASSREERLDVVSADGTRIPVRRFARASVTEGRAPAAIFLHAGRGGQDDIAPRHYQEIGFLTALGFDVYAVNFRGSTGYGDALKQGVGDLAGQVNDVRAALAMVLARQDVDSTRLVLVATCYGAALVSPLYDAGALPVRAVVEWVGAPMSWLEGPPRAGEPPLVWVSGVLERGAERYGSVADVARLAGHALDYLEVTEGHWILERDHRALGLERVRRLLQPIVDERGAR